MKKSSYSFARRSFLQKTLSVALPTAIAGRTFLQSTEATLRAPLPAVPAEIQPARAVPMESAHGSIISTTPTEADIIPSNNSVTNTTKPSVPIVPPALKTGDKIAIVSPAGGTFTQEMQEGIRFFESMGCKVEIGKFAAPSNGYLAATDEQRAKEFNDYLHRDDIKALVCSRGGYGVMRILDAIDYDSLRLHPKIVIGYSDITALVNAIYSCAGVVAFHGAVASSKFDEFTAYHLQKTLFNKQLPSEPSPSPFNASGEFQNQPYVTLSPGVAVGRLVGGNLSLISDLMGTRYEPVLRDSILFLEEINEEPFRIDRMLTQLLLSEAMKQCKGIAIGRFTKCRGGDPKTTRPSLESMLQERAKQFGIPVVYGLPFGHVQSKLNLPIGVLARLDATNGTLTFLENSVA